MHLLISALIEIKQGTKHGLVKGKVDGKVGYKETSKLLTATTSWRRAFLFVSVMIKHELKLPLTRTINLYLAKLVETSTNVLGVVETNHTNGRIVEIHVMKREAGDRTTKINDT